MVLNVRTHFLVQDCSLVYVSKTVSHHLPTCFFVTRCDLTPQSKTFVFKFSTEAKVLKNVLQLIGMKAKVSSRSLLKVNVSERRQRLHLIFEKLCSNPRNVKLNSVL